MNTEIKLAEPRNEKQAITYLGGHNLRSSGVASSLDNNPAIVRLERNDGIVRILSYEGVPFLERAVIELGSNVHRGKGKFDFDSYVEWGGYEGDQIVRGVKIPMLPSDRRLRLICGDDLQVSASFPGSHSENVLDAVNQLRKYGIEIDRVGPRQDKSTLVY